ncbi:MAG TPA: glycoside hydrolase family 3 N-terminal domain-containing protein [Chitinivibrionales bacterium]|nr:glycoside hydrolase family 3 N-terminal domain-containing protein [Chitinivibrionales bacterium]
MKQWIQAILCVALLSVPAGAMVTGRAVDGSGNPVPDAMVYYTSIANRLDYVYSNPNGDFCLPSPTEWNLADPPMYKSCVTAVHQFPASNASVPAFNVMLRGSAILFSVGKGSSKITADIFTIAGKHVARVFDKQLGEGSYSLNPFAQFEKVTQQTYVIRISDGAKTASVSLPYMGRNAFGPASEALATPSPTLKKIAAIDQLRVGKTGYTPKIVNLTTYSDNVGDVAITSINIEAKTDSILALMTVAEKVGQCVQVSNAAYITSAFAGSFLKGSTWAAQQSNQTAAMSTRMKIPVTIGTDYVHGGPMVYFPHNVGMSTTGDTLLTELAYRICGICCRQGNNENFAPCIDVPRNDKNGRVYEGWGENVDVTKHFARAAVRGLQGSDLSSDYSIIATCKHFAGAGGTTDGIMRGQTATGTWDVLCRIHLPQFHAAVDAGAAAVMTSYNSFPTSSTNNAQLAMTCNTTLITDTLKNGWGFTGYVISDWDMGTDASVGGTTQGPINALNAGLDVAMQPDNTDAYINALKGAAGGQIPQARIDDAAKRCIRVKLEMGLFTTQMPNQTLGTLFSDAIYRNVARACVRKAIVLLKNSNSALPLSKTAKIAVVGAWADNMGVQCGGWSETGGDAWQGSTTAHGIAGATTILQGMQAAINTAGGGSITYYANGTGIPNTVDKIVVVVGETPYAEDAGYRADITLGTQNGVDQAALVQTCASVGKPVITILLTGRPNVLGTIPDNSTALVAAWLPGTEGEGVSDVLFGDYNFVGKLPYTWPANNNQEPVNEGTMGDAVGSDVSAPLYQYGFGLTY